MRGLVGLMRLLTVLVGGGVALAASAAALAPHVGDVFAANASTSAEVDLDELALRSIVYDANGAEFDVLYDVENRGLVTLDEISEELLTTVVVVEDEGFWDHNGIDARAIVRALIENVSAGDINQGGSTITQQLVKNGVIGDARDLVDRKIPEAALAIRLEGQLEKEEILEAYLNTVYFGGGAYGIRAAAEIYFGTDPSELDWAQSAMLAALISNPSGYDPTRFPELAKERRTIALESLVDTGHLTDAEFDLLRDEPLPTQRNVAAEWQPSNYFIEEVRRRLLEDPRLGATAEERTEALFGGGLRVFTTYDPVAQSQAEAAIATEMASVVDDPRFFTAALASIEPGTGKVRAVVGGPGFDRFEFNIATQKGRPTGSSFKTFVLAAAFEKGIVPADQVNGIGPCTFENPPQADYRAVNFGGSRGSVKSIRGQTLSSSNCAFLRLGEIVGLSNVADTATALGLHNDRRLFEDGLPLSMPLGPLDVTPLEMAAAYAAFPNDGVYVEPVFIERVEDRYGNVVFENRPVARRAVTEQTARLVTDVLEANVRSGTGNRAAIPGQPAGGKTGTGQSFYDATFVGFTPHLATAIWMGNPEEQVAMRNVDRGVQGRGTVTGGSIPARIWGRFNISYHENRESLGFADPAPTRSGIRLRTDNEERSYNNLLRSPCGSFAAELDTDEDGIVDACEDVGFRYDPNVGRCPSLLIPVDTNDNGIKDACVPPPPTTTVPPPSTTAPPTPTTAPPPTTSSPPTTTTPPPTTTVPPTTTAPPTTTTTPDPPAA